MIKGSNIANYLFYYNKKLKNIIYIYIKNAKKIKKKIYKK